MARSVAQSTAYMTMASVLQKVIAFVYFTLVARTVGVEDLGKYQLALQFTTIFVVFVDLGFTNVLIREAAKFKNKMQTYFSTVLTAKLVFGVFTYIAAILTANLLGYEPEIRTLIYLSAVTMLFDSFHLTVYGMLRSIGDLRWEAAGIIATQGATLVLGGVALWMQLPLIYLILAFTIPSALNFAYAAFVARKKYDLRLRFSFSKETFRYLGVIAVPFAIAGIFARVYSYIDSLLLKELVSTRAVGLYSIATKITFAFQFIPLALVAALYPRFSESFVTDKKRLAYMFERSMKYLMIVAFPIAIGIAILAKDIVVALYTPEYLESVLPLQILIVSLLFSFVSFPIGAFLNACNKQVTQTVIVGFVMVINIALNLLLIPQHGIVGAATAAFVGNALLALFGYLIVPQITKISHTFIMKTKMQLLVSVLVMGVCVWYTNSVSHFVVAIAVGAVVYPLMLVVTRVVTRPQIEEALHMIKR